MSINLSKESQIEEVSLSKKAIETRDKEELRVLANSSYMNVRRAVARNSTTPSSVLSRLAFDPVRNVNIQAMKHFAYRGDRKIPKDEFDNCSPCLVCNNDMCQGNICPHNGKTI